MGIWNFYFVAKLFLYFERYINFHVLPNLIFAALLLLPVRHPRLKLLRHVIAVPIAIGLFYHDTWLPSVSRVLSQASQLEGFRLTYLLELTGRLFNPIAIGGLVLLYAAYYFAEKKIRRLTVFVLVALLLPLLPFFSSSSSLDETAASDTTREAPALPAAGGDTQTGNPSMTGSPTESQPSSTAKPDAATAVAANKATETAKTAPQPAAPSAPPAKAPVTGSGLTASLESFYRQEATRTVAFAPPKKSDAPFDIIFLQICSLSWDDLDFSKEKENPLFKRFNIVFSNFNSAATYSGPAAIRALRGSCGQPKHGALYDPVSPQCLTFDNLQRVGFEQQLAMNHDGHFGGMISDIRVRGAMKAALFDTKGLAPYLQSFDESFVQDDYGVLSKWWEKRVRSSSERVALFYNSISLHDGNRYADGRPGNSMEIYRPRLATLLGEIDRFFNEIQTSGRRALVVFIPEHGAALRGDKMQIPGMREIPSPRITLVPVGIKLIGPGENRAAKPLIVSKPTSYLAISQLVSNFVRVSPFGKSTSSLENYVRDLPATEFVAENNDVVVMRHGKDFFVRSKDTGWVEYDPSE